MKGTTAMNDTTTPTGAGVWVWVLTACLALGVLVAVSARADSSSGKTVTCVTQHERRAGGYDWAPIVQPEKTVCTEK